MHVGYIVKVKELRKHENADRLQIATFFGNDTIVDLSVSIGDMGIYFPIDLQLSEEFCKVNDLVRRKDENGNPAGGYLDPGKRNIKAVKLRGEKSDGLYLPLSCLDYTGVKKLEEGATIDVVNGHEICCKYIPKRTRTPGEPNKVNKTRKHKIPYAPLFKEHADTEQLAYNKAAFRNGDFVEITLKMHGCFVYDTKVRMGDMSTKKISTINVGDMVMGYNFDTQSFEPTKVVNVWHNDKSNKWNKIKISRNHILGDKRGYITATYNHPFWSKELNCWVEAKNLAPGMKISTGFPSAILTQMQKEILLGLYLGDGSLSTYDGKTAEMQHSAKHDKEDYVDYLANISNGLIYKENKHYISEYGTEMIRDRTHRSADMYNYFSDKVNGKAILQNFVTDFSPLSLAIFYMDDGSLAHTEKQRDRASFAICDYEDTQVIQQCFNKLGLNPVMYKDSRGYNRIRLNADDAFKMFDMIYKYIPSAMRYKLPEEYRDKEFIAPVDTEKYITNGMVWSEQEVLENIVDTANHYEYDLETELHNYIVGYAVVHNTSARTGYLPVLTGQKRSLLDKILRREGTPIYDWGYASGTRRTVLEDFGNGGFYGNNEFREKHAKQFEGKLLKGETAYYEIVGYTTNGTAIMGDGDNKKVGDKEFVKKYGKTTTFSYGCEVGESDMYAYRMTMTNEDGDVVEYTPDFMRYRCEQMGVKYVPLFWRGIIPDGVDAGDWITAKAEEFYDGADPVGKTHIREGVVCRIVNRPKFAAYKHKNFFFKVLSGIIVDSAKTDDEDILSEM